MYLTIKPRHIVAMGTLAFGAVALNAIEASAGVPAEPTAVVPHDPPVREYNYPNYDPQYEVSQAAAIQAAPDDTATEALQAGASALGGAGIALAGAWLLRRRHLPASVQ